ncbi:hypothetical protein [Caloranaerobacter azorensis]|uniref:Uncharacterized protein n=1 Tax=Caloranaerobacter azorensis DSM 13643 TaxID=1121264 RepID=A0A1M5WT79_9FIRM|nr:hypothetical protein [Caloranaerobacter azorensis]SHH90747.1 hypothetical protein SAMN02745135_02623 [Caloranaerobacter azorensis DSM 13643]
MEKIKSVQLLINQFSLIIATIFFVVSCLYKNFWLILIGLGLILYTSDKIKKSKEK